MDEAIENGKAFVQICIWSKQMLKRENVSLVRKQTDANGRDDKIPVQS